MVRKNLKNIIRKQRNKVRNNELKKIDRKSRIREIFTNDTIKRSIWLFNQNIGINLWTDGKRRKR